MSGTKSAPHPHDNQAAGLRANTVVGLAEQGSVEYEQWSKRGLFGQHGIYVAADDIHARVRPEDDANKRQYLLVLLATARQMNPGAQRKPGIRRFRVYTAVPFSTPQAIMGATADNHKELIAAFDGYRASEQSGSGVLLELKPRGLERPPHVAVGDGA